MRYIVLVLLNIPIILAALLGLVTQYKTKKISKSRLWQQVTLWLVIFLILAGSFPAYNYLSGKPILDSAELSSFDIVQTSVIIYLIYIINNQRRKIEQTERFARDLHQELSISISSIDSDKK